MFVRNTAAKHLVRQYVKPVLRRMWPWRHKNLNGIRVNYLHRLDGGGTAFGQGYIPYLRNRGMPRQARTFEWCAGPGFIGFSLLGCGLTETLCLTDIEAKRAQATSKVAAHAKPESADFAKLVAWLSIGAVRPSADDFDMVWLFFRTLLPQVGGLVLMLARR
jgi:hypothetical protein